MSTGWFSQMAVHLVQGWISCYTRGLPAAVCEARRQEIESDLWEHQRHGALRNRDPAETAVEVLARLLMGIPADLIWRWEMGRWVQQAQQVEETPAGAGESRKRMAHAASQQVGSQKWLLVIPAALAVFAVGVGLDNLWGAGENTLRDVLGSPLGAGIAGGFLPAVLLVVGLAWSWRSPGTGVAVTLGLMFLYFALLMAWVGLRGGWVAEGLLSLVGAAGAILYLTGLAISRRRPQLGGALAMSGAIPMALTLWWSLFMPLIALLLGVFALRRAQRFAQEQPSQVT